MDLLCLKWKDLEILTEFRSSFLWFVMQHKLVAVYWCIGTACRSHIQGSRSPQLLLYNNTEEWIPHLNSDRCLKSTYKVVFDRKHYSVTLPPGSNTKSNLPSSETTRIKIVVIVVYIHTHKSKEHLTSLTIHSFIAVTVLSMHSEFYKVHNRQCSFHTL
jgi:hypothetical protein